MILIFIPFLFPLAILAMLRTRRDREAARRVGRFSDPHLNSPRAPRRAADMGSPRVTPKSVGADRGDTPRLAAPTSVLRKDSSWPR